MYQKIERALEKVKTCQLFSETIASKDESFQNKRKSFYLFTSRSLFFICFGN